MTVIKSVNLTIEAEVVPEVKAPTAKELLILEASTLGIETDGLTNAQLKEAIKAKKAE